MLSPEEATRALRFRFIHDRNRFIVKHGVLRILLARYMDCRPKQVNIRSSTNGKPYLEGQKVGRGIYFNTSRSEGFAAFVFSLTGNIGIDIEKIVDIAGIPEIVTQHFTFLEKHDFLSCPEKLRAKWFYKVWTRKEAVLKAQGNGLLLPLDCVDVVTNKNPPFSWKVKVPGLYVTEEFWVADIEDLAGYAIAVAAHNPFKKILIRNFDVPISICPQLL